MVTKDKWFHNAVIYEIYPATFTDKGLKGITEKLDYIRQIGADAIWLCPVFASDFKDSGYDIKDYYKINPRFGCMEDFDELINRANKVGLKIILDIALNHTSNTHYWFQDAINNKESKYREYYIFREGKNDSYPNNWISSKTLKPTWTYNENTDDYYLHIYTQYQPDLNWENKNLRREIADILNFWIDKGVSGFRLDVINKIAKPNNLEDMESEMKFADYLYENNPVSMKYIDELRRNIKSNNILLLGQLSAVNVQQAIDYVNNGRRLDLFLQFEHIDIDKGEGSIIKRWSVDDFKRAIFSWQSTDERGAMPTVFFGSHDSPRMVNHYTGAKGENVYTAAKMLCALQLLLKGTQIIYMGDELALTNVKNSRIDDFKDIRTHDIYMARRNTDISEEQLINELNYITRDNARFNIPWDIAEEMTRDKDSVLNFYKKIIKFRKNNDAVLHGATRSELSEVKDIFAYSRLNGDMCITVICNMKGKEIFLDYTKYGDKVDISNYNKGYEDRLLPYEVKIFIKRG